MSAVLKVFFCFVLAFPGVAAWGYLRGSAAPAEQREAAESVERVPVKVLEKGREPRWIYVESGVQAVPEPSLAALLAVAGVAAVLRRRRR